MARLRNGLLVGLVAIAGLSCACLPIDKAAAILGYVPADDPGLVEQIEQLVETVHEELGD